jgi:hypothetical protein
METRRKPATVSNPAARPAYHRDDEEYETIPRWLWTRLHADLVLSDSIAGRLARRATSNAEGGQ